MDDGYPDDDRLGVLERHGERHALRFTRTLTAPPEVVWRALTEEPGLAAWFPTTIEGEAVEAGWRPGLALRFGFRSGQGPPFEGRLLAADPPVLLELAWSTDVLRFELRPLDRGERAGDRGSPGGTELELLLTLADVATAARDGAGWHACLARLAAAVTGGGRHVDGTAVWLRVHARYAASLGPQESVTGPPG